MNSNELKEVLDKHTLFLKGKDGGERADLSGANLRGENLSGANLSGANLRYANLRYADLRYANLSDANLSGANLSGANLSGANLSGANLRGADLSGANLSGANLSGADLFYADLRGANLFGSNLIIYQSGLWPAYIQEDTIRIGCQYHSVKSWESFTDEEISKMHDDALRYWKENKEIILSIASRWMAIT